MLLEVVDLILVHGALDGDRREQVVALRVDLAGEPAERHVEDLRQAPEHRVTTLLGQVGDPDLHLGTRGVGDDRVSLVVEDRAARGVDAKRAELVVLRRVEVTIAREHLERPEPEEDEPEEAERDRSEDADPERETGCEAVRLLDLRIGGQEAARDGAARQ